MASGNIVFNDTFTEASNTALTSHTPDTGTGWTSVNAISTARLQVQATDDRLEPDTAVINSGQTATADATYPSADYHVSLKLIAVPATSGDYVRIYARYASQALNGYYSIGISNSVSNDPDIRVGASATTETILVSHDNSNVTLFAANDIIVFEVVGSQLALFVNEVCRVVAVVDANVTAAGKAAVTMGAFWAATSDNTNLTDQRIDDFQILQLGANITAFANPTTTGENNNDFTNTSNAYSSNDVDATVSVDDTPLVRQDYGDFGFSINSGDTITGVQVRVEGGASSNVSLYTITMELSKDNGASWPVSKVVTAYDLAAANTDYFFIFGHGRSLWGTTWSPSDFDNANFRVRISVNTNSTTVRTFQLDHISVKVFSDAGAGGGGEVSGGKLPLMFVG